MPALCAHCGDPVAHVSNDGGSWASVMSMSLDCPASPTNKHVPNNTEGTVTEQQTQQQPAVPDVQTLIQSELAKALGGLNVGGQQSFEEALKAVDPRDSEAALAMLDFLLQTGRLGRVGVLDGGQGYLFVYQEPKGSSKQGYKPGATQGDRIVDEAVDAQRASGNAPAKRGMCPHCYSVVKELPDGKIVLDENDDPTCSGNTSGHGMA